MLFQKKKRSVPQLNASSTADISIVLLILFLVTTSMDVDKGLHRQLPPLQPTKDQTKPQEVDKSRIMTLHIDSRNNLTCNGAKVAIGSLRQKIVDFITVAGPQQHIIRLEADPASTYDTYFQTQNEIANAYLALRNQEAQRRYGTSFARCSEDEKAIVSDAYPQRLAEVYHEEKTP